MKRILSFLFVIIFTTGALATGIGATDTTASCDNNTLGQTSGTANIEVDWEPNTINIRWYNDENQLSVPTNAQSCVYGNDLYLPTTQPTKTGYTFKGWTVIDVPMGYTKLEYIQTTGTQWIDTEISPQSDNIIYRASWLEPQLESVASLFGNANYNNSSGTWPGTLFHPEQSSTYIAIANSNKQCKQNNITANQVNNVEIVINNGNMTKTQNGTTCTTTYDGTVQIGSDIALFRNPGASYTSTREQCKYTQLFYWEMYDNNVLVRNMIPVRRNSDGEIGMYDTVSGRFFTNAGTNDFIAGPIVLPNGYTRLEYLESSGTQYIDTGWAASTNIVSIETQFDPILSGYSTPRNHFTIFGSQKKGYKDHLYMYGGTNDVITNIGLVLATTGQVVHFTPSTGKHSVKYIINNGSATQIYDGVSSSGQYSGTIVSGANLYLFAGSLGDAVEPYDRYRGKIYTFKIYENNVIVRDMIPVRRDSDNELGMYDIITNKFFTNRGTGTFTAGPVVQ